MKEYSETNLINLAKKKGKLKNVEEAFIEYPVSEEWHKGKVEYLLQLNDKEDEYFLYKV